MCSESLACSFVLSRHSLVLLDSSVKMSLDYSSRMERHLGEWMLSSWYDNIPGPNRLIEVSTSQSEADAWEVVNAWCCKLLTPGVPDDRVKWISDSLINHHWQQAVRMGCLGVQFTYINGFYHRFVWRAE